MRTRPQPNLSKFERLEVPTIPAKNADAVREFIEGISSFGMLSLSGKKLPEVPKDAKVFVSRTLEYAFTEANFGWAIRDILRRVTFRKPMKPNQILDLGFETIRLVSRVNHRARDVALVIRKAEAVTRVELARKINEDEAYPITKPIVISAAFVAGIKAIEDVNFEGRQLLVEHALERWKLIEGGFGIYAYDGNIPYIYYQKGNGDSGGSGSFGPFKFS